MTMTFSTSPALLTKLSRKTPCRKALNYDGFRAQRLPSPPPPSTPFPPPAFVLPSTPCWKGGAGRLPAFLFPLSPPLQSACLCCVMNEISGTLGPRHDEKTQTMMKQLFSTCLCGFYLVSSVLLPRLLLGPLK